VPVHLLTLQDFTKVELVGLIERAVELKNEQKVGIVHQPLAGKTIGLFFEKPSLWSRVSFESAMYDLGGQVVDLSSSDPQLLNKESLKNLSPVMSSCVDGLVVSTSAQKMMSGLADYASVPVINALTELHDPCQVLGDMMTVVEKRGTIEDLHICWLGPGSNVANSLIQAAAKIGFELTLVCPENYEPNPEILAKSRSEASRPITLANDPEEAVRAADVINLNIWDPVEQKKELPYQLDAELLGKAPANCIVLHSLPAHRGEEVTDEVWESGQCAAFGQVKNKLHINRAILESFII